MPRMAGGMNWSKLTAEWAMTRAAGLRKDARRTREAYTQPAVMARMKVYADALEAAADVLEKASAEIANIGTEASNG